MAVDEGRRGRGQEYTGPYKPVSTDCRGKFREGITRHEVLVVFMDLAIYVIWAQIGEAR